MTTLVTLTVMKRLRNSAFQHKESLRLWLLEDMIVDKQYRGQDIGSKLIDFAIKNIKAKGCMRVTLLSDGDNFKAHKFYEKQGFIKSTMIPFRKAIDIC